MIQNFDDLYASFAEVQRFDALADGSNQFNVGIEAAEFLSKLHKFPVPGINRPVKEALLPAMGGTPLGLKAVIKTAIGIWRAAKITPIFVFSGLDVGRKDATFAQAEASVRANASAWSLYDSGRADEAVEAFSNSGSVTSEDLFRYLQTILREEDVRYQVAPYTAWAQVRSTTSCPNQRAHLTSSQTARLPFEVPSR
jgi:hypothetical protein